MNAELKINLRSEKAEEYANVSKILSLTSNFQFDREKIQTEPKSGSVYITKFSTSTRF